MEQVGHFRNGQVSQIRKYGCFGLALKGQLGGTDDLDLWAGEFNFSLFASRPLTQAQKEVDIMPAGCRRMRGGGVGMYTRQQTLSEFTRTI